MYLRPVFRANDRLCTFCGFVPIRKYFVYINIYIIIIFEYAISIINNIKGQTFKSLYLFSCYCPFFYVNVRRGLLPHHGQSIFSCNSSTPKHSSYRSFSYAFLYYLFLPLPKSVKLQYKKSFSDCFTYCRNFRNPQCIGRIIIVHIIHTYIYIMYILLIHES